MHVHHAVHDALVELESHDLVRRTAGHRSPVAPTSPRLALGFQFFAFSERRRFSCGAAAERHSSEGNRRDYTLAR
jgi:hypothetical protein